MDSLHEQLPAALAERLVSSLGADPAAVKPLGGSAQDGRRLLVTVGGERRALLKVDGDAQAITSEVLGLRALARFGADAVVPVLDAGDDPPFSLVRWLGQQASSPRVMHDFGVALATLHRHSYDSEENPGRWGFEVDNWLGGTLQRNRWEGDAVTFVALHRIGQQRELLAARGADERFLHRLDSLIDKLPRILDGSQPACLLHGDLWSGNVLLDASASGNGVVRMIDPAPWWGPREAELGMTRLFGGLPHHQAFWSGYTETWPLERGSEERIVLFELYHLLNHWTLFGAGYRASCEERLARLGV